MRHISSRIRTSGIRLSEQLSLTSSMTLRMRLFASEKLNSDLLPNFRQTYLTSSCEAESTCHQYLCGFLWVSRSFMYTFAWYRLRCAGFMRGNLAYSPNFYRKRAFAGEHWWCLGAFDAQLEALKLQNLRSRSRVNSKKPLVSRAVRFNDADEANT